MNLKKTLRNLDLMFWFFATVIAIGAYFFDKITVFEMATIIACLLIIFNYYEIKDVQKELKKIHEKIKSKEELDEEKVCTEEER